MVAVRQCSLGALRVCKHDDHSTPNPFAFAFALSVSFFFCPKPYSFVFTASVKTSSPKHAELILHSLVHHTLPLWLPYTALSMIPDVIASLS
jgi:hypothetical protein